MRPTWMRTSPREILFSRLNLLAGLVAAMDIFLTKMPYKKRRGIPRSEPGRKTSSHFR